MPQPTGSSQTLSYAQLKGVWLDASRGTKYHTNAWASLMAAIAWAESRGDPTVTNPNDNNGTQTSWGLWQISNGTHSAPGPNWGDPVGNAKLAIGKLDNSPPSDNRTGPGGIVAGLGAWGTYDSGAYRPFVSDKTTADTSLAGVGAGLSAAEQAAVTAAAEGQKACAWSVGWGGIPGTSWLSWLTGGGGNVGSGEVCLLSKSQVRSIYGVGMVLAGGLLILVGLNWMLIAAAGPKILQVAGTVIAPEAAAPGKALGRAIQARRKGP